MTIIQLFDYAVLDVADRTYIELREGQIKGLLRNTARNIIDTGKLLSEVKDRLEHGQFMTWCEQRFGWSLRTAERYMAVADKFDTLSHLEQFSPTALYSLAAPSTPDEVVDDMTARAAAGETITPVVVKTAVVEAQETRQQQDAEHILDLLKNHDGPMSVKTLRDRAGMGMDAGRFYRALSVIEGARQVERLEKGLLRPRVTGVTPPPSTPEPPAATDQLPGEAALHVTLGELTPAAVQPTADPDPLAAILNQQIAMVCHDAAVLGGDDLRLLLEAEGKRPFPRKQLMKWFDARISEIPASVEGLTPDEARIVNSIPQRQREMLLAVITNQLLVHNAATRAALINRGLVNSHPSIWAVTLTEKGEAVAVLLLKLYPPAQEMPVEPAVFEPSPVTAAQESDEVAPAAAPVPMQEAVEVLPPGVVIRDLHVDPTAHSDDHDPDLADAYLARLEFERAIIALQDAARAFCAIKGIRALYPLPTETLKTTGALLTDMQAEIGRAQRRAFTQFDRLAYMSAHHHPYDEEVACV